MIEDKLKEIRGRLVDPDYPLDIDEILGELEYLFEGDKEVSKVLQSAMDVYNQISCFSSKLYQIKQVIDETFYEEG